MNLHEACWGKSRIRANTWHLFYAAVVSRVNNADTCDGSACGLSTLGACEVPQQFTDTAGKATYPPFACPSCKMVWDSWGNATFLEISSPHPTKPATLTRRERRRIAYEAECGAIARGAMPDEAKLEGRRAYAASAGKPLPTSEDLEHTQQLAKNREAGLNVETHPPLVDPEETA